MPQREPNKLPISQLPLLTQMVHDGLENTINNYRMFQQAEHTPYILDDATVQRAQRVYTDQRDDLWLYDNQCEHWLKQDLSGQQRQQVKQLQQDVDRLRKQTQLVLDLLAKLATGTIDQVMRKSDEEVGLDFLRGRFDTDDS
jgi:hypothetical protein